MRKFEWKHVKVHLIEFLIIGALFGIIEDVIAIALHEQTITITPKMALVAAIVAIPFAIISEIIIDYTEIFRMTSSPH